MWKIEAQGVTLDVMANFAPSFSQKNNAFAFGSLELSRTLSFNLPSTPTNVAFFQGGNDYHTNGARLRVFHNVQLIGDSVCFIGSLYAESADKKSFKCVFTFGELSALKALSEAGKITASNSGVSQQLRPVLGGNSRPLTQAVTTDNADSINYTFVNRQYYNDTMGGGTSYHVPSVRLSGLLANVQQRYGVTINVPQSAENLGVVLTEVRPPKERKMIIAKTSDAAATVTQNFGLIVSTQFTRIEWYSLGTHHDAAFAFFEPTKDISITFPTDFPDNVFCCDGRDVPTFFGGYSFDTSANGDTSRTTGRPLAGRTVKIPKTDEHGQQNRFSFFLASQYINTSISATNYTRGFAFTKKDASPFSYEFGYTIEEKPGYASSYNYYLEDNLPDISYIDIINIYALISGGYVRVRNGVVDFAPISPSSWATRPLANVINAETVKRCFSDFGKNGSIVFDSADYVKEPTRTDYSVNNATLTNEKTVYKIGLSDGDGASANSAAVYIRDFYNDEGTIKLDSKKATLVNISASEKQLQRVSLPIVADIVSLCDTSTAVEVSCKMTAYEYFGITDDTVLLHDGAAFVWLSSSWSNGIAKFSLQKFVY